MRIEQEEARLADLARFASIDVVRDAQIGALGFVIHRVPNMLTFARDPGFAAMALRSSGLVALITSRDLADQIPDRLGLALADDPEDAFFEIHRSLCSTSFYSNDFPTEIDPTARVSEAAYVAPKNVRIGAGCLIEPRVTILEHVEIGEDSIVRAGTTLGSEGFQFRRTASGIVPVPHAGSVRIGARVEIQSNCAVDRSVFRAPTTIGDDSKLDNLVHIAHAVVVGCRCLVAAGATIAGNVTIGDDVWIGPGCTITDSVTIGARAQVVLGTNVFRDVAEDARISGPVKTYRV